jgi:uncharacterized protein YdeI (YjbR/CyaY-like superfamily)
MDVVFFESPVDARTWLGENHDRATELWVGFHKKGSGNVGATYAEVLDQMLCFGWIDGIRKSLDPASYTNRFTPRRRGSIWSDVNIKRVGELIELGLMEPPGLKAFNARNEERSRVYSFEQKRPTLNEAYEAKLRANEKAWSFFQVQAPWYQRTATWWIMSAKREETRQRRLATLIEDSEHGRRLGNVIPSSKA